MRHVMSRQLDEEIAEANEALGEWKRPVLADDVIVCECFCVSLGDIRNAALEMGGEIDVEYLQQRFHLGTGCGSCLKRREEWAGALKAL